MLRVARWVALGLLFLALAAGKPTGAPPSGATDGDAAGFARARTWFGGLGYPDPTPLPFVRVWTGGYQGVRSQES